MDVKIGYKLHYDKYFDILDALKDNGYHFQGANQYYKGNGHAGVHIFPSHDNIRIRLYLKGAGTGSMPEVNPKNLLESGNDAIRMILRYVKPTEMKDGEGRQIDPRSF